MVKYSSASLIGIFALCVAANGANGQSPSTPGVLSWPENVKQSDGASLAARISLRQQELLAEAGKTNVDPQTLLRRLDRVKSEVIADFESQRRQLYAGVRLRTDRHHRLARGAQSVEIVDGAEQKIKEMKWEIRPPETEASNWKMIDAGWNPVHSGGDPHTFAKVATIEHVGDQYARFNTPLPKPNLIFGGNIGPIGPKRPKWVVNSWAIFELRAAYIETLVLRDVRAVEAMIASQPTPER